MGQIIRQTDNKFNGPWLLDGKAFEELDETLGIIDVKLEEAFNIVVERTAGAKFEEMKLLQKDIDIEKAKERVRNAYPLNKSEKFVQLISKDEAKIRDKSVLSLLKDSKVKDFRATKLSIHIEKGTCSFVMEIDTEYTEKLTTKIQISEDDIFEDVNYEINKWIDKYKPNLAMQKWSSWFPWVALPAFLIMISFFSLLFKNKSDIYKDQLAIESHELLKDGITPQKQNRAIELLLQIQSNYTPENFDPKTETNKTVLNVLLVYFILLIILLIKPKTVIGIGKNAWKVVFYKRWVYFVLVYIPLTIIIPIVRSKLF